MPKKDDENILRYRVSCRISGKEKQLLEAISQSGDFLTLSDFLHAALNICARIYLRNVMVGRTQRQISADLIEQEITKMFLEFEDEGLVKSWAPDVNKRN